MFFYSAFFSGIFTSAQSLVTKTQNRSIIVAEGDDVVNQFAIITESTCDLSENKIKELNIKTLSISVMTDDGKERPSAEIRPSEFYAFLRKGGMAKTAAVNTADYLQAFEGELMQGRDVLHLGFSSGLSASYNCACMAAEELRERYPNQKIYTVDTLSGSLGQGLLVYLCAKRRAQGQSIDEVRNFAQEIRLKIAHIFTVDDLGFLKRGGRVSSTVAVVGGLLNIKPMLCANNEGKLAVSGKVRGRAAALKQLAEQYAQTVDARYFDSPIFISHSDCIEDAKRLADMVSSRCGRREVYINDIGPGMGAHCGPDTLAIFYISKER